MHVNAVVVLCVKNIYTGKPSRYKEVAAHIVSHVIRQIAQP